MNIPAARRKRYIPYAHPLFHQGATIMIVSSFPADAPLALFRAFTLKTYFPGGTLN